MKVSAIIPNWNGLEFLPACLRSLEKQTHRDLEVIIIENGSTDGSLDYVRRHFPKVKLITFPENIGFAPAMNAGLGAAKGEYIAFLNNDMEFRPDFIAELVACLERHPRAASVSAKQVQMDDHSRVASAGGDIVNWYMIPYARGYGFKDRGQYETEQQVFSASGGSSLWRRDVLKKIGAFDPDFFAYYEDIDLGYRARLAGYESWYAPRAIVYHAVSATGSRSVSDFVYYHPTKNRWFLIIKNMPFASFLTHFHKVLFGEIFFLKHGLRDRKLHAMLRAYGRVILSLPTLLRKRRHIRSLRTIKPADAELLISSKFPPSKNPLLRRIAEEFPE